MTNLRPKPPANAERDSRGTPPELYAALDREFGFTLDPCPLDATSTAGASLWGKDGLRLSWAGQRVFCNPPYSDVAPWLGKALEAVLAVYLLPVKTDLGWWHEHVMHATEVRFVRGRIRFAGSSGGAPFPSAIIVFDPAARDDAGTRWVSYDRPARVRTAEPCACAEVLTGGDA